MKKSKQSGCVLLVFSAFLIMVSLAGVIGNHPPRKDPAQHVDVCKMNGTCPLSTDETDAE